MKLQELFEDVRISNIHPGHVMFPELEKLAAPEIKQFSGKSQVQNVKQRFKGATFAIVTYKDPTRYYFRIDKQDISEGKNHLGDPEYNTWSGWRAAAKKKNPDVWFEGDKDIAQAMVGPKPYKQGETKAIGEWDGEKGSIFSEKVTEEIESAVKTQYKITKDGDDEILTIKSGDAFPYRIRIKGDEVELAQSFSPRIDMKPTFKRIKLVASREEALKLIAKRHNKSLGHMVNWEKIDEAS